MELGAVEGEVLLVQPKLFLGELRQNLLNEWCDDPVNTRLIPLLEAAMTEKVQTQRVSCQLREQGAQSLLFGESTRFHHERAVRRMEEGNDRRILLQSGTQPDCLDALGPLCRQGRKNNWDIRLADGVGRINGDFFFNDFHTGRNGPRLQAEPLSPLMEDEASASLVQHSEPILSFAIIEASTLQGEDE